MYTHIYFTLSFKFLIYLVSSSCLISTATLSRPLGILQVWWMTFISSFLGISDFLASPTKFSSLNKLNYAHRAPYWSTFTRNLLHGQGRKSSTISSFQNLWSDSCLLLSWTMFPLHMWGHAEWGCCINLVQIAFVCWCHSPKYLQTNVIWWVYLRAQVTDYIYTC